MTDAVQPPAVPPSTEAPSGERCDAFLSYSRKDRSAADGLASALEERGKDVWVDVEDILAGADWRARINRGIEACTAFVFLLSPASLASEHCRQEVELAAGLNKLIIPVLLTEVDEHALPAVLADREWVFLLGADGLERLVEALETDLEWRDEHTRLAGRTREWLDGGRNKSFLLRGVELREAERWLSAQTSHREAATAEQAEYIVVGRRAALARQRTLLVATSAALAIAVGLAIFAYVQRNDAIAQRQAALSRGLIAQSQAELARDPSLAGALSIEAFRVKPTFEARTTMLSTLRSLGRSRGPIGSHAGRVSAAAFGPGGATVASASYDGSVRLWDMATRAPVGRPLTGHKGAVLDVAFRPDGALLASAGGDGSVRLWDVRSRREPAVLHGHAGAVRAVAFSPDGKLLTSAGEDGTVRLWDVASERARGILGRHREQVEDVAFGPTGATVASAGLDGTVRLWSVGRRRQIRALRPGAARMHSVALSRDGRTVAGGTANGEVRLWETASGRALPTLRGHDGRAIRGLDFDPRGRLVSGGDDGTLRLWDVARGRADGPPMAGHDGEVYGVAFSADGRRLASAGDDRTVRAWDVAHDDSLVRTLRAGRGVKLTSAAFGRDALKLATGADDGTVVVWDVPTGRPATIPQARDAVVNGVAFSPDGSLLASAGEDGAVRLRTGAGSSARSQTLLQTGEKLNAISFDRRAGRLAAAGKDKLVHVWGPGGRGTPASLKGHGEEVTAVDFSPDGALLASASVDGTVRLWDAVKRRGLGQIGDRHDEQVLDVAFGPDGATLATAERDGTVRLWDVAARKLSAVLRGDTQPVFTLAFSPDGSTLAAADDLGRLRLWDVRSRRQLGEPHQRHRNDINGLAFDPGGRLLASASSDGTVGLWSALLWSDESELERALCTRVWRSLSQPELLEFLPDESDHRRTCPRV